MMATPVIMDDCKQHVADYTILPPYICVSLIHFLWLFLYLFRFEITKYERVLVTKKKRNVSAMNANALQE